MKKIQNKFMLPAGLLLISLASSCSKSFTNVAQLGSTNASSLATKAGVEGLLIGAYSMLDGVGVQGVGSAPALTDASGGPWETTTTNWIYGGVCGGDAHKGSTAADQVDLVPIQRYASDPSNGFFNDKWITVYASIQRCNDVLTTMALVKDGSLTSADTVEIRAEAVFLRGLYHFEAKKMWNNIPYIDENTSFAKNTYLVSNTIDAWPKIEADFQYAIDHLPATQPSIGQANSWAAKAFLVKCYMFEKKFAQAEPILLDLITNGTTSNGTPYALYPKYGDIFDAAKKNGSEFVFSAQNSVNDGGSGSNGNAGDILNFPYGGPSTCCGFDQPSYSIANSYKTDPASGLPLLTTFNDGDLKNDEGIAPAPTSGPDTFIPYTGTLDPRLDWSVGRRGLPYLDWGNMPGASWIREQSTAGPYIPIKFVVRKSEVGTLSATYGGWATNEATADNYAFIRVAHLYLWYAECAAQGGDLATATGYVNKVRERAANPAGFVFQYNTTGGLPDPTAGFSTTPAADYFIQDYPNFPDQATALQAIYFENKIEFASEGHRFFDLVRWGIAATEINDYIQHEQNATDGQGNKYGDPLFPPGTQFTANKDEYYPIPQPQIDASVSGGKSFLTQNPGY
jgi:starch-binding outer membrane protein, SusD/RagB family